MTKQYFRRRSTVWIRNFSYTRYACIVKKATRIRDREQTGMNWMWPVGTSVTNLTCVRHAGQTSSCSRMMVHESAQEYVLRNAKNKSGLCIVDLLAQAATGGTMEVSGVELKQAFQARNPLFALPVRRPRKTSTTNNERRN